MTYLFDNSNLEAEMRRKRITKQQIAEIINISESTVYQRFLKKPAWKYTECLTIRNVFFPEMKLEYLFPHVSEKKAS